MQPLHCCQAVILIMLLALGVDTQSECSDPSPAELVELVSSYYEEPGRILSVQDSTILCNSYSTRTMTLSVLYNWCNETCDTECDTFAETLDIMCTNGEWTLTRNERLEETETYSTSPITNISCTECIDMETYLSRDYPIYPEGSLEYNQTTHCLILPLCLDANHRAIGMYTARNCCVNVPESAYYRWQGEDRICVVHGFQRPTYTVLEGESVEIVFQRNAKGQTRFPRLDLRGNVTSYGDPADYRPATGNVSHEGYLALTLQTLSDDIAVETNDRIILEFTSSVSPNIVELVEATGEYISHRAEVLIIDEDIVEVGIEHNSYTVMEGAGSLDICVTVQNNSIVLGTNLTLQLQSVTGTAQEGLDYMSFSERVSLSPRITRECISVGIIDDMSLELNESMTVSLALIGMQLKVQISPSKADVFISDDDRVTIGFKHTNHTVLEGSLITLCVGVLSGGLGRDVSLQLQTQNITALGGLDFEMVSGPIVLSPNVSEFCVFVETFDDQALEINESMAAELLLSQYKSRVTVSPEVTNVFIIDNDELRLGFEGNYTIVENVGEVEVCINIFGELGSDVSLLLSTQDGTAADGEDFRGMSNHTITLTSADQNFCVPIVIVDEDLYEETEFFMASLSISEELSQAVHILQETAVIFIQNDDDVFVNFTSSVYATNESSESVDVCVSVVQGKLGTNITLELTITGTARADADFYVMESIVSLSPTKLMECIEISVVNDEAVELSESVAVELSPVGELDSLHISHPLVTVEIMDDDVAVVALEKMVTMDSTETFRFVNICAATNNTLERSLNLTLTTNITGSNATLPTVSRQHTIELLPNATHACMVFNITVEQELVFSVISNEDSIEVINPNGTIVGEPSLVKILSLINRSTVDLTELVEALDEVVNSLIKNNQTASRNFSQEFIDVVSKVLDITNQLSSEESEKSGGEKSPGTSLLKTLDKFALQSFNASFQSIESNNTKIEVLDQYEVMSDTGRVRSVSGPDNEKIEILADALGVFNSTVTIGSYYFRNVSGLLPNSIANISDSELVSPVLSSALWCEQSQCISLTNHSELVHILLHHRPVKENEKQRCVFYDLDNNVWSEDGCTVSNTSNSTYTVCSCSHLTHFAVMLSPKNSVDEKNAYALQLIGYVGTSISLALLLIIIFIFSYLKSLWSMRNYIHINLCISLFVSQLLFIAGVDKYQNQVVCQTIAVVLHYAFLVTFMWMLMEGVVLYVALVKVFVTKQQRYIVGFTVFSYGGPLVYMALVVPLGFLLPRAPHYGGEICWLRYDTHFIWALISPVILIILINIGFFAMAIYIIWKQQKKRNLSKGQIQNAKHWLKVSVSLLVIMGISWIIGVITFHKALLFVSYIFTIVVAFQGAIMFIMFVVLSKQVRLALKKWLVQSVIMKSDFLSDRFSEFTRTTQAGQNTNTSTKSTVAQGVQLGLFLALPAKPSSVAEMKKEIEATVSRSPSPAPSTPYASSCSSPEPPLALNNDSDADATDTDEGPPNTFNVLFVATDKDSDRVSPDTDTVCAPPPDNVYPFSDSCTK